MSTSSAFLRAATQAHGIRSSKAASPLRTLEQSTYKELRRPLQNAVAALAVETASEGYGALIFCGGRKACEATALLVSRAMPDCAADRILKRQDVLDDLRTLSVGLDESLAKILPMGVAFHRKQLYHLLSDSAGLTLSRCRFGRRGKRNTCKGLRPENDSGHRGHMQSCCRHQPPRAASNHQRHAHGQRPHRAGYVVSTPEEALAVSVLRKFRRQMRGRAGRKGKDEVGETYLCCNKEGLEAATRILEADLPNVESSMTQGKRGIKR